MPSAEPLIDRPAETLREAQSKTHCHPLRHVKIEVNSNTLVEVEASKMVGTCAESLQPVAKVLETLYRILA